MSETRHTLWEWDEDEMQILDSEKNIVVDILSLDRWEDGPLLAAAPELLAACEAALPWLAIATASDTMNTENAKADLLALQVAIAKAGGEPGRGIDDAAREAIARAKGETP